MIEDYGKWYFVDGESGAHGKARDVTITYEYDDIYDAILEVLEEDVYGVSIQLGEAYEDIADFLGANYTEYILKKYETYLIADDYGAEKEFNLLQDCITDLAKDDLEIDYEYTEMV